MQPTSASATSPLTVPDGGDIPVGQPPFEFVADLLVVAALVPVQPLPRAFPGLPFAAIGGRIPILAWYSQTHELSHWDSAGQHCTTNVEGEGAYAELTMILPLWRAAVFSPHLEAASRLSQRIALVHYGMPKDFSPGQFERRDHQVRGWIGRSYAIARIFATIPWAAAAVSWLLRRFTWPVLFPSGYRLRPVAGPVGGMSIARLRTARLAIGAPWLPRELRPLPIGLYLSDLQAFLPHPGP